MRSRSTGARTSIAASNSPRPSMSACMRARCSGAARPGRSVRARRRDRGPKRRADRAPAGGVLRILTDEKAVFSRQDITRALHRALDDDAVAFQNAFAAVMASPALVTLQPERCPPTG